MIYSILVFFAIVSYVSALHNTICDSGFINLIGPCVRNDAINIDVLAILDTSTSSRFLCHDREVGGIFRYTPENGAQVDEARVLWGDGSEDVLSTFPCAFLPPPFGNLSHPQGSVCATGEHTYQLPNGPGEYPVGIFATTSDNIISQREGIVTIHRCVKSVNIDLIAVTNSGGSRDFCAGDDIVAQVRATVAPGAVSTGGGIGGGNPGQAQIWWGELDQSGPTGFSYFPTNGSILPVFKANPFPNPGQYIVAIFADTNEGQEQLESMIYVPSCQNNN